MAGGRPWPVGVAGDPWPVAGVAGRGRWPWPWPVAGVAGGRCRWPATKNDYSAFHRTVKNDTFLSINIDIILQWSGLADELLLADTNTIKGWWSATSQLI